TQEEMTKPKIDPYDSHPSLPDRIKALEGLPPGPEPASELPALSLLENAPGAEAPLAASLLKPGTPALRPVAWPDVGIEVQVPYWEARVRREAQLLAGQTVANIPRLMLPGDWAADAQRTRAVTIGAALAVALVGRGWTRWRIPSRGRRRRSRWSTRSPPSSPSRRRIRSTRSGSTRRSTSEPACCSPPA